MTSCTVVIRVTCSGPPEPPRSARRSSPGHPLYFLLRTRGPRPIGLSPHHRHQGAPKPCPRKTSRPSCGASVTSWSFCCSSSRSSSWSSPAAARTGSPSPPARWRRCCTRSATPSCSARSPSTQSPPSSVSSPTPACARSPHASEEPWRAIWLDHREAFTTVATQISEMSQSNRVLLTAGYQAAQATLLSLTEKAGRTAPTARWAPTAAPASSTEPVTWRHLLLTVLGAVRAALQPGRDGRRQRQRRQRRHHRLRPALGDRPGHRRPRPPRAVVPLGGRRRRRGAPAGSTGWSTR